PKLDIRIKTLIESIEISMGMLQYGCRFHGNHGHAFGVVDIGYRIVDGGHKFRYLHIQFPVQPFLHFSKGIDIFGGIECLVKRKYKEEITLMVQKLPTHKIIMCGLGQKGIPWKIPSIITFLLVYI